MGFEIDARLHTRKQRYHPVNRVNPIQKMRVAYGMALEPSHMRFKTDARSHGRSAWFILHILSKKCESHMGLLYHRLLSW